MTHEQENIIRRKLTRQLKREGWRRVKPLTWCRDGVTVDLDAGVWVNGVLRAQWATLAEERGIEA